MNNENVCREIEELISGYLDGELTQQDSQKVASHLQKCKDCQKLYQELNDIQVTIGSTLYSDINDKVIAQVINDLTTKRIEGLSWILILIGLISILTFGAYQFWFDTNISWPVRLMVSLLCGGGFGLFISVLRQKLFTRKNDKYRNVKL